jgi:hypothetical protein
MEFKTILAAIDGGEETHKCWIWPYCYSTEQPTQ